MLLRASGQRDGRDYELTSVTSTTGNGGVAAGDALRALTEASIGRNFGALDAIREEARTELTEQQIVDALTVAAAFNGITRVADATGIPLDANTRDTTGDMRADTGIDDYAYQQKSARYS